MQALIDFNRFFFNRASKIFTIDYNFYDHEILQFRDVHLIQFKQFSRALDCFCWLKTHLYQFYTEIEIDVPFELVEFRFKKYLRPMGLEPYEY